MRRILAVWVGLLAASLALTGQAQAKPLDDFNQRIDAELRAKDPALAEVFKRANDAREHEDHAQAEQLYAEVFDKAPTFLHAERRRCGELLQLGRRDEALKLCRDAVDKDPSAPNLSALAGALITKSGEQKPWQGETDEAKQLLERAQALDPNDSYIALTQCQVAVAREDVGDLRDCSTRLEQLAPSEPTTAWASWLLAMSEGHLDDAEGLVERARKAGAPPAMLAMMENSTSGARPWTDVAWRWGLRVIGGWLGLSLLLVLSGSVLSKATLRTAENWTPESARRGATLRAIYRAVLVVCSMLYYLSLPLVLLVVVAVAGGLVYGMFAIGYVPIKLGLIAGLMVFATIAALVKSLFYRASDEAPGIQIDLQSEPGLRATLDEVAQQIGTRAVDTVYMTPDTNLAVFERKRGERCLVVGAGVLEGMPLLSFKAILAHEYGHFSHRDTAGGGFALSVRRSLLLFIIGLAQSGHASPWNPAWWFAKGFYRIFLFVSQGASRLQEILADRRAAEAYGGQAFKSGLKHVLACDLHFEDHVNGEIKEALKAQRPLQGLWSPLADHDTDADELNAALNRKPSPYDSHPAPCDRIRWVEQVPGVVKSDADAGQDAWSIFKNRAHHEREVTLFVYQRLAESGVRLPALPKV